MSDKLRYGIASKAWQFLAGCSPNQPCAPGCWARRTVARVVECQRHVPHCMATQRAEFFAQALTPDLQHWSGKVVLDEAHLMDPLHWKKSALIASGFHGDWGLLPPDDKAHVLGMTSVAWWHRYMLLSKQPEAIAWQLREPSFERLVRAHGLGFAIHVKSYGWEWPIPSVLIGCSLMTQADADAALPHMRALAEAGWKCHVWNEPAIGPINWTGWEFLECIIFGGESGAGARTCRAEWASNTLDWCRANGVKFFMKQGGSAWSDGTMPGDPKAKELENLPEHLRVRELPEGWRV